MKNLTRYLVIRVGYLTASGQDEVVAAFQYKYKAVDWLISQGLDDPFHDVIRDPRFPDSRRR